MDYAPQENENSFRYSMSEYEDDDDTSIANSSGTAIHHRGRRPQPTVNGIPRENGIYFGSASDLSLPREITLSEFLRDESGPIRDGPTCQYSFGSQQSSSPEHTSSSASANRDREDRSDDTGIEIDGQWFYLIPSARLTRPSTAPAQSGTPVSKPKLVSYSERPGSSRSTIPTVSQLEDSDTATRLPARNSTDRAILDQPQEILNSSLPITKPAGTPHPRPSANSRRSSKGFDSEVYVTRLGEPHPPVQEPVQKRRGLRRWLCFKRPHFRRGRIGSPH
ncbi:hypothetical protein BU26DRAFT_510020 [Trematosphaeria pertusa]|uniref:Uncharacterized protein n=1 Tax=Trematosphaeria pertusa TaxID=390896 RepID=A0A6A6I037_9PLEO|nr:uncharacterized protein BU26DRAFT_510020 [Trematosphaeria pertusa]KAF2243519.1 hypothetical protein BU26DRAFT_510020 [Trematosphaeria pertusa]